MVVDDVENDGHASLMRAVDETLERERAAIRILRRPDVRPVITPVARPRKLADRHEFDRRDAEVFQRIEFADDCVESPFLCERADM